LGGGCRCGAAGLRMQARGRWAGGWGLGVGLGVQVRGRWAGGWGLGVQTEGYRWRALHGCADARVLVRELLNLIG
jgi:hypothetical protein